MDKKYVIISICALIFSFFFLTFGFCAFTNELTISDIAATVRRPLDVRITNLYLDNASSGVESNNLDYNTQNIISDIRLPENGSITYNIEFTNYTNYPVYLMSITNLPDNLKYEIDLGKENKYTLNSLFIQNQNEIKEISLTISYKENGYDSTNENYNLNIGFYFESSYEIIFQSNTSILPHEYEQLEYIQSTGTEWINTNYIPNSNTTIETKIESSINRHTTLYCSRTSQQEESFTAFLLDGATLRIDYGSTQTTISTYDIGTSHIFKQNKNLVYVDDMLIATIPQRTFETKYNMYLFASHTSEGAIDNIGETKLYYTKIWDNETLVRNFIPCYRKSDGKVGLYDLVNKKFYYNQGTGEFVKGPKVNIVSTSPQSVLTGQTVKLNKNNFEYPLHAFLGWNTKIDGSGISYKDEQSIYNIGHNNETITLYAQWRPYQSVIKFDANGGIGQMKDLITPYGGNQTLPINLFKKGTYTFSGWNTKPDGSGISYAGNSIINVDVTNGDVNMTLYAIWSIGYQAVEYIQSSGTQWINTNFKPDSNSAIELKVASTSTKHTTLYCSRTNLKEKTFTAFLLNGKALRVDYGSLQTNLSEYEIGTPYIYKQKQNKIYVNNEYIGDVPDEKFETKYNMYLFASHISEASADNIGDTKLYYAKIWDNGKLVRDFIPCCRMSDGEIGLYDLVNDEFYSNKGTGTFIKGPDL